MSERRTVAITGADGLVGSHLARHLASRGWSVRSLVRDPAGAPDRFRCALPDEIDERGIAGADWLVHCAYTSRFRSLAEARRTNEEGTARVLALCRAHGVRFCFVSTTSAHEGALSYYGRSKLALERSLEPERDLVIRPGLVLAPSGGGLFARIRASLERTGVVPLFDGGRQRVQTVHVRDLCAAFERALADERTGTFVVAEPDGVELRELFAVTARLLGIRARFVPLPSAPVLLALRAAERLRIPLPISSENLLGLRSLRVMPSRADLDSLGVRARPAAESLAAILDSRGAER